MTPIAPSFQTAEVQEQAQTIFDAQRQAIYCRTDRLFALLMALQWGGAVFAALSLSPRTWVGTQSAIHPHVWAALLLGGLISSLPIFLALTLPGQQLTRQAIAVSQLLMSALLIHVTGGQASTHFHIFGSLAFLAFYRDWRVLVTATIVTATDHLVRGALWPESVYGLAEASPWLTAQHIGWVAFEDLFLLISCRQSLAEMHQISLRQAQLEVAEGVLMQAHITLEARVERRTQALAAMQHRNELLLNSAGEGIYGIDNDGITQFVNPRAAQILGYEIAELLGKPMHALLHHTKHDGSPYPNTECPIYHSIHDGEVHRIEDEVFWRKEGTSFPVQYISTPLHAEGQTVGAVVTFQDITERKKAKERILALNAEITDAYDATIEGLSRALDYRDRETHGHSERVTTMALRMARAVGFTDDALTQVRRGALLHDIGKMAVPDSILHKPGPLTPEERAVMCRHTEYAHEMLWPIAFLRPALVIPLCHHEKWDGTGYPGGLAGEDIPLAARIFAMIDVWDALRSDRPYREAWNEERVLDYLRDMAGVHFDPSLVPVFLRLLGADADGEKRLLLLAA